MLNSRSEELAWLFPTPGINPLKHTGPEATAYDPRSIDLSSSEESSCSSVPVDDDRFVESDADLPRSSDFELNTLNIDKRLPFFPLPELDELSVEDVVPLCGGIVCSVWC